MRDPRFTKEAIEWRVFEVLATLVGWDVVLGSIRGYITGELILEPRLGGRLFERRSPEAYAPVLERGRVLVWNPPTRLAFTWRAGNFAPHESTQVEVLFEPTSNGTCVTLRHSGWAALRPGAARAISLAFERAIRGSSVLMDSPQRRAGSGPDDIGPKETFRYRLSYRQRSKRLSIERLPMRVAEPQRFKEL